MKRIMVLLLCILAAATVGAASVSAQKADEINTGYYSDYDFDVGEGVEDTVEEELKGCVGGATALPLYAIVIAGAAVIIKKRL